MHWQSVSHRLRLWFVGIILMDLTAVINPTIKFKWLKENWKGSDYEEARRSVRASV